MEIILKKRKWNTDWVVMLIFMLVAEFLLSGAELTGAASRIQKAEGVWKYTIQDGYATIHSYTGNEESVQIPSELDGYKVKELGYYFLSKSTKTKRVVIPGTVERIDSLAFDPGLDNEGHILKGSLESITVSGQNKEYASEDGVLFSKDKKSLLAYPQAKRGKTYKVPTGTVILENRAFCYNCIIQNVTLPKSVERIKNYVFMECQNLSEIKLNQGLWYVGIEAFSACGLKSLKLPKSLVRIESDNSVFDHSFKLKKIQVESGNPAYCSINGVLLNKDKTTLYMYPEGKSDTTFEVPASVKTIKRMSNNPYLKKVILQAGIEEISHEAFVNDKALTMINLPKTLKCIREDAFRSCYSLEKVTIPAKVESVGERAFQYCKGLKKIIFKGKNLHLYPSNEVIPENTVVCGSKDSKAYYYAKNFGRTFQNTKTSKITKFTYDADGLIKLLPTSGISYGEPASTMIQYKDNVYGDFAGYKPAIIHETNTSKKRYQQIKKFTDSLVKNCGTDREKVIAISDWVHGNMKYVWGSLPGDNIDSVYGLYERLSGNCMCYTQLTNYMLYLEGIPTAIVDIPGHERGAAFADGEWILVDSQGGMVGGRLADDNQRITAIIFTSGRMTYEIRGYEGVYLAAVGYDENDAKNLKKVEIPAFVNGIYENVLYRLPANAKIKAKRGGAVEKFLKKNYKTILNKGNWVVAKDRR